MKTKGLMTLSLGDKMTYHFTALDQIISNHIANDMTPKEFMDECYNIRYKLSVDHHGNPINTFSKAIGYLVDSGAFLVYYQDAKEFIASVHNELGYLPYDRSRRSIIHWSNDQTWKFYRDMVIRSGIKYLDLIRKVYEINYNGIEY